MGDSAATCRGHKQRQSAAPRRPGHPAAPLAALALLHVVACLIFSRGFLLTRVELPDTSSCPGPGCPPAPAPSTTRSGGADDAPGPAAAAAGASRPPYDRAVILIVDALRYDVACEGRSAAKPHAGRLPRTMALVGAAGDAAVALRFVADTPTITMSRLKALLTGGLPTFLDVGSSFSASQVAEDNLLSQLKAAGECI